MGAIGCIGKCVEQSIGADVFEKARAERENLHKVYLAAAKICDERNVELRNEYEKKLEKKTNVSANVARLKYKTEELAKRIENDKKLKKTYAENIKALEDQTQQMREEQERNNKADK